MFKKKFFYAILTVIILCCLGLIIYSNTFNSPFQFDDKYSILGNSSIKDFSNISAIWKFWPTRFITYLSVALNYHYGQFDVFGYHWFNLFVHLAAGILVWQLALLTFEALARDKNKIGEYSKLLAFFAAAIFIAHPIQTEAVTYIIQRTTSLAALFYLAALSLYVKARLAPNQQRLGRIYYLGSLAAGAMAMFTKEMAISLPFALMLYEFCFLKKEGVKHKLLIPFFFLPLVIPLVMWISKTVNFTEMRRVGEQLPGISPLDYFLTQFSVMATYLRLLILPLDQNIDYDYPIMRGVLPGFFLLATILFFSFRIFTRFRIVSFCIFWFFLTLLPESSFVPIKDVIFEHRLYLPMVGFSLFLASSIYYLAGKKNSKVMVAMLSMVVIWYALLTYTRNFDWIDKFSLWDDTVRKSPGKARPYINRGTAYASEKGEHEKAIADFQKALMLYYGKLGIKDDYTGNYEKLLAGDGGYSKRYDFIGIKYIEINEVEIATILFLKAVETNPANLQAYIHLAAAYGDLRKYKDAIMICQKALEFAPDSPEAHYNLSVAYFFDRNRDLARKHLETAVKLGFKPNPEFLKNFK